MAFPTKTRRTISIAGKKYHWVASGDDDWISLRVRADVRAGQVLACAFNYHTAYGYRVIVTPYIVRQVIEYGLARGWNPYQPGPEIMLGHLDNRIDLT